MSVHDCPECLCDTRGVSKPRMQIVQGLVNGRWDLYHRSASFYHWANEMSLFLSNQSNLIANLAEAESRDTDRRLQDIYARDLAQAPSFIASVTKINLDDFIGEPGMPAQTFAEKYMGAPDADG